MRARTVEIYYWLTLLFAGLDLALGVNVRAAALDDPWARALYYASCLACAAAVHRWPSVAGLIALVESSVNLLLLILAFLLPYYRAIEVLADGGLPAGWPPPPSVLINMAIASVFWVIGYLDAALALRAR